ncbi:HAD family hydrolase [Lentzea sp. NPDC092896]|uniref:HAD family hydrolase n=1 Tax=Lentzea sp. NPDC092896 TaxID=3364127 RepID=UPI00382EB06E
MSVNRTAINDIQVLRSIFADTDAILLDFDGPVCSVFAGFPAPIVAEQLRDTLSHSWQHAITTEAKNSGDPFDILSFAATIGDDEARYIEAALRAHEVEAISTATPTAGAHEFIRRCHDFGRKLAIVSNNSTAAVEVYLHLHELAKYVDVISARADSNLDLLKPSGFLLHQAATRIGVDVTRCALIGDSVTDIRAAKTASAFSIGYANKAGKIELFTAEHPNLIITDMTTLRTAISTNGRSTDSNH